MIWHDCKIVDWEVKHQHILGNFLSFLFHLDLFIVIIFFKNKILQGSEGSHFGIKRLASWWQMVILGEKFLYPSLIHTMDLLFYLHFNSAIMFRKKAPRSFGICWDATTYSRHFGIMMISCDDHLHDFQYKQCNLH